MRSAEFRSGTWFQTATSPMHVYYRYISVHQPGFHLAHEINLADWIQAMIDYGSTDRLDHFDDLMRVEVCLPDEELRLATVIELPCQSLPRLHDIPLAN